MKQYIWFLLVFILILSSCSKDENQSTNTDSMDSMSEHEKLTYMKGGIIEDHYVNEFFGIELELPKTWIVLTEEEMARIMQTGQAIVSEPEQRYDVTELEMLNLLGAFKYPFDEAVAMNPSLYISAERLDETKNISSGEAYLEKAKVGIEHLDESIVFDQEIETIKIQEKIFTKSQATIDLGYMVIYQVHYVTLTRGYALNIIATYMEDEDLEAIEKMLGL